MADDPTEEVSELTRDAQQLLSDVREGVKSMVGITDIGDLVKHLQDFVWPTLEAVAEQAVANAEDNEDLGNICEELASEEGEMLTAETAGIFANTLLTAAEIAAELEKRLAPGDTTWKNKIAAFKLLMKTAEDHLTELTVDEPEAE